MRIVVTGSKGQVVSALLERANEKIATLISAGRPELDLTDRNSVWQTISSAQPDVIVSAAAFTAVDLAEDKRQEAFQVNAIGAGHVAEAAQRLNVPIIHISTDYVFDGTKRDRYVEDDPVAPINFYGKSKLAGEYFVQCNTDNHAILRTSWVYSPFASNFLKTILRLSVDRDVLTVVGDQIGAPTSALDIADGILSVAKNLTKNPDEPRLRGTFHMTADGEASWASFAHEIMKQSKACGGPHASIEHTTTLAYGFKARRPENSRLSIDKLEAAHGARLPFWHNSVGETVKRVLGQSLEQTSS